MPTKKFKGASDKKDNKENENSNPVNRKGVLLSLVSGDQMEIPEKDIVRKFNNF